MEIFSDDFILTPKLLMKSVRNIRHLVLDNASQLEMIRAEASSSTSQNRKSNLATHPVFLCSILLQYCHLILSPHLLNVGVLLSICWNVLHRWKSWFCYSLQFLSTIHWFFSSHRRKNSLPSLWDIPLVFRGPLVVVPLPSLQDFLLLRRPCFRCIQEFTESWKPTPRQGCSLR